MGVESLPRHPRLHPRVKISRVHFQNAIHARSVDGNAAKRCGDMAFQRRSGAVGNDRGLVPGANRHDLLHLHGALHKGNSVRRVACSPGLVLAVLLAHNLRG